MAKNACKKSLTKKFSKNTQNVEIFHGNFLGLLSFSPIENGQNTCKKSLTKNFSKNAQNIEIFHGNFFGFTIIFTHIK